MARSSRASSTSSRARPSITITPTTSSWRASWSASPRSLRQVPRRRGVASGRDEQRGGARLDRRRGAQPGHRLRQRKAGALGRWHHRSGQRLRFARRHDRLGPRALVRQAGAGGGARASARAGRLADGRPLGYALGWGITEHLGHRVAWHDGDWIGASAYIARYLDDALTVILLSNGTRCPARRSVPRQIAAMYLQPGHDRRSPRSRSEPDTGGQRCGTPLDDGGGGPCRAAGG